MALAGSWGRAWGWQAVGRSAPILTGFVWEGNVPPALTGGNVGGQILARDERFPLLFFFFLLFFFTLVFTAANQTQRFVSLGGEEELCWNSGR